MGPGIAISLKAETLGPRRLLPYSPRSFRIAPDLHLFPPWSACPLPTARLPPQYQRTRCSRPEEGASAEAPLALTSQSFLGNVVSRLPSSLSRCKGFCEPRGAGLCAEMWKGVRIPYHLLKVARDSFSGYECVAMAVYAVTLGTKCAV